MAYKPRYDTPTDGISRKQFDRANDKHIRRYAILAEEVRDLGIEIIRLRKEFLKVNPVIRGAEEE